MTARAVAVASRAVGYVRVSTAGQASRDKASLPHQRKRIADKAAQLGVTVSRFFEDLGRSGATAEGRPGFMALVEYCEANPQPLSAPGYVLIYDDTRLGRFPDFEEATEWRRRFARSGWNVRFAEGDDTEDPLGRAVLRTIYSAQATAERQNISRRAKMGAQKYASEGYWQTEAPLGYRRQAQRADGTRRILELGQRKADDEKVKLVPGPVRERALVRFMFERYATGTYSLGGLADEIVCKFPERRWSRPTVRQVLRNRAYLGELIWGRRPSNKRSGARIRPRTEWVIVKDAHPALIERELFDAVQDRLRQNKRQTRATRGGYPLSGLIRCAQCGETYTGGGGPINRNPKFPNDPDRYRFYRDKGGVSNPPKCAEPLGTLQKRWIDPVVIGAVADIVSDRRVQRMIAEEFDRAFDARQGAVSGQRRAVEEETARLTAARERLVTAIANGTLSEAEAGLQLTQVRERLDTITADSEQLRFSSRRVKALAAERDRLLKLAFDFKTAAQKLEGAALRELLRPWLHDAVMDKERRRVVLTVRRVPAVSVFSLHSRGAEGRGSP